MQSRTLTPASARFSGRPKMGWSIQQLPLLFLGLVLTMLTHTCRAEPRSLFIRGPLPIEYTAETAQFGNPLIDPIAANLMLPPDNPWLCEYPPSLQNLTSTQLALLPHFRFDEDIALFVSVNRCSAETKARVVQEMRERITNRIRLVILYSTNPQEFDFVSLPADDNTNPPNDLADIGVVYIPHRYASGIDLRMRMQYQGDDPRFGYDSSEYWDFPIEVTALSDTARPRRQDAPTYSGGDIYWFRIILFSLLIASPCCRACYLWYAGGGRLHWRRNEDGRIVGIQYIPPMPLWLTTGRPHTDGSTPSTVLTEEQFNTLPEIIYKGSPTRSDYDSDEERHDDDAEHPNVAAPARTEIKSGSEQEENASSDTNNLDQVDVEAGEGPTSATSIVSDRDHDKAVETEATKDEEIEMGISTMSVAGETGEKEAQLDEAADVAEPEIELEPAIKSTDSADDGEPLKEASVDPQNDTPLETPSTEAAKEDGNENVDKAAPNESSPLASVESSSGAPVDEKQALYDEAELKDLSEVDEEEISMIAETPNAPRNSTTIALVSVEAESQSLVGETQQAEESHGTEDKEPEKASVTSPGKETAEGEEGRVSDSANEPVETPQDPGATAVSETDERETISTSCAICIDEFENGEKLTLLPRCRHAFHRECIHEWLTERQGCCPLCKVDVMEPNPDEAPGELDLEAPAEQRFMISSM